MKRTFTLLVTAIMAISLSACAAPKNEATRVKCPACGYEFQVPMGGA